MPPGGISTHLRWSQLVAAACAVGAFVLYQTSAYAVQPSTKAPPSLSTYTEALAEASAQCRRIPAMQWDWSNYVNPDAPAVSYWGRSACFQSAAERLRADALCDDVWRRPSMIHPSWQYSEAACRSKVADRRNSGLDGVAGTKAAIRPRSHATYVVRCRSVRRRQGVRFFTRRSKERTPIGISCRSTF